MAMGKRVMVVFEEGEKDPATGNTLFQAFLEGLTPERRKEIDAMTPHEQMHKLSPSEFWALRCFQITRHAMQQSGAFLHSTKRGQGS